MTSILDGPFWWDTPHGGIPYYFGYYSQIINLTKRQRNKSSLDIIPLKDSVPLLAKTYNATHCAVVA